MRYLDKNFVLDDIMTTKFMFSQQIVSLKLNALVAYEIAQHKYILYITKNL